MGIMRLADNERSEVRSASRSESQVSEAQRTEACWTNYPIAFGYWELSPKRCGVGHDFFTPSPTGSIK